MAKGMWAHSQGKRCFTITDDRWRRLFFDALPSRRRVAWSTNKQRRRLFRLTADWSPRTNTMADSNASETVEKEVPASDNATAAETENKQATAAAGVASPEMKNVQDLTRYVIVLSIYRSLRRNVSWRYLRSLDWSAACHLSIVLNDCLIIVWFTDNSSRCRFWLNPIILQVELLLQQMQERFQGISDQVLSRNILLKSQ